MKTFNSITELIGNTPILRLNTIGEGFNIYAKCEFFNPLSIKDRVAYNIIAESESRGLLKSGDVIVEATSGNTGSALAFIAAMKGYKIRLYMSEDKSIERRKIMAAFGAELVLTPAAEGTAGAKRVLLEEMESHPEFFYVSQHFNPFNGGAHYKTTGPEIWEDMDGQVDIFVCGLGTCGTSAGVGKYLKEKNPNVQIIGLEPENAPLIAKGFYNKHLIMGIGSGMVPGNYDPNIVDEIVLVSEKDAFAMTEALAKKEGVLVGISSGAVVHAMTEIAQREGNQGKNIVGILADTGERYLSVKGLFE